MVELKQLTTPQQLRRVASLADAEEHHRPHHRPIHATRGHHLPRSTRTLVISIAQNTWNDGNDTAPESARLARPSEISA